MVSDHGFNLKKYDHADYGFYSLNVKLPDWWKVESILDFKENIVRLLSNPW